MSDASWSGLFNLIETLVTLYLAFKLRSMSIEQTTTTKKVEEVKDVAKTAAEHAEEVKQVLAVATQTSNAKMADLKTAGEARDEKMGAIVAGQEAAAVTADKILIHVNDKLGKVMELCGELAQFKADATGNLADARQAELLKSQSVEHIAGQADVDAKYPPKTG